MTTLMLGGCLFSGFVSGMTTKPQSFSRFSIFHPFRTEIVNVDDLAWISAEKTENFKIAQAESIKEMGTHDLIFTPYEFKPDFKRPVATAFQKHRYSNFPKLSRTYAQASQVIRDSQVDDFQDFKHATETIQESIQITKSSAVRALPEGSGETAAIARAVQPQEESPEMLVASPVIWGHENAPKIILHKIIQKSAISGNSVESSSQRLEATGTVQRPAIVQKAVQKADQNIAQNVGQNAFTQQKVVHSRDNEVNAFSNQISDVVAVNVASDLSPVEKVKLKNALLAASVSRTNAPQLAQRKLQDNLLARNERHKRYADQMIQNGNPDSTVPETMDESGPSEKDGGGEKKFGEGSLWAAAPPADEIICKTLSTHSFIRPLHAGANAEATQLCPKHVEWLSKDRKNSGWAKLEVEDALPTLTLHPAPNDGATLLLDVNSLALLSMKTGVHVTKGMGLIVGLVPEDYKIEFLGRGEEVEYFESNGRSYFAVMNAEPGAGIISLESKSNPSLNSAVFAPVIADTVTYLDLGKPTSQNLSIQVVKTGKPNDPDVMHLTVGLATQAGIQAITQQNGIATLQNVNLVRGFPLYIDVSSRHGESAGYSYRFQLKHTNTRGLFVVNQIEEKSISTWLAQVKLGLSDQSAMVVGFFDRKKIDGFKTDYFTRTKPLTAKYGLDPLNFSVLWDGKISDSDPLEGDLPRFMSVQVPEGLSQIELLKDGKEQITSDLFPISPRVIHVVSE